MLRKCGSLTYNYIELLMENNIMFTIYLNAYVMNKNLLVIQLQYRRWSLTI
jgi:hypothetical protein